MTPLLPIIVPARAVASAGLVDVGWVARELNADFESVHGLVNPRTSVDHGSLHWVWDVSPDRKAKALWRFLPAEVLAFRAARAGGGTAELLQVQGADVAAVIAQVIGTEREWLRSFDLARLLSVSDTTVLRLRPLLPHVLVSRSVRFARAGLVEFLRGRIVE